MTDDHCDTSNDMSSHHPTADDFSHGNSETQPLLGHHSDHDHAYGSYSFSQAPSPPAYHVDMSAHHTALDPSGHHPCHRQHHRCHGHHHDHHHNHHRHNHHDHNHHDHDHHDHHHNHYHHRHDSDNQSDCSRCSRREKGGGVCCCILLMCFIFVFLFSAYGRLIIVHRWPWDAVSGSTTTTSSSKSGLDLLTNDSGNLNFDRCRNNAINWDGPSTFTTEVKNFGLKIGEGNIFSWVNISTGPVALPTLRVLGEVSPLGAGSNIIETVAPATRDGNTYVNHQGLHIVIVEQGNQMDVQIWYDNREVVDPRDGQHYRACARLFLEVILPESYTSYGDISIDGPVIVINAQDLENVKFDRLHFGSSVGEISTRGRIQADVFDTKSSTGSVRAEIVQVATAGKPLDIQVSSNTGSVQVNAETTDVEASENTPHRVHVSTKTGRIQLTVQPSSSSLSSSSSSSSSKHGNLDISTTASTGSIDTTIALASQEQILTLVSKTNTGSNRNHISDAFLGHFSLSTKWGSTKVEPAKDSKSTITYEKLNTREKVGNKALNGGPGDVAGLLDISSVTGSTALVFTN